MMNGYHNQPGKTAEAEWCDSEGNRFIRTGDVGRFDERRLPQLLDRRKDMIISGGFNIYPSDLESRADPARRRSAKPPSSACRREHGARRRSRSSCSRTGRSETAEQIKAWTNERLGKTQRLAAVESIDELPRSAIGKVLKRELREKFSGAV